MKCNCSKEEITAAAVALFHARMGELYNGLSVTVGGSGGWWTGDWTTREIQVGEYEWYWSGVRYEGRGSQAVYSYTPGKLEVRVGYALTNKGSWDEVNGRS